MYTLALRVLNRHLHYYADQDYLRNQAIQTDLKWYLGLQVYELVAIHN